MKNSEIVYCTECSLPVLSEAFYCHHCGIQIKCKICQEPLPAEAKNCTSCGSPVLTSSSSRQVNTFKLRENKEERVYEIQFTNEVGKEIKEVIADLLKTNGLKTDNHASDYLTTGITEPSKPEISLIQPTEVSSSSSQVINPNPKNPVVSAEFESAYPHLNDLEIKLNCKENEWLLLISFYNSDYGATTFTKDIVWQVYKDKRKTETRFKNLGTNWKSLFRKYIATVKDNEFRFTQAGLQKVKSLLLSDESDKKNNSSNKKGNCFIKSRPNTVRTIPVSRKVVASSIVPNEFDVYQNNYKESLESFFRQKNPGNGNPNRIITIAYYITKINHQEYFTEGNIDYAYRILNLGGKPAHLKQVIINLKNERIWFQKTIDQSIAGWKLTRQGEIYVEEKLPARS